MINKKCINCREYKNCKDSFSSWIFFIIGLIATIAVRVVTLFIDYNPIYAKIAWYIGVIGFFIFFIYKFQVGQARTRAINKLKLNDKVSKKEHLTDEDYKAIGGILCSLSSNKEKINYFFIFALSGIALLSAIFIDFIK